MFEMIVKTVKVLRNNWKKSIFFSSVAVFGLNYSKNKFIEYNKMRVYCEEAFRFGADYLRPDLKGRHITVILNPTANKRKSKANYDKYCAPLLHLAGVRVSLVITEEEGQARSLMEIMDNTDGVLVAGGNGTVHEAITGLLRRADHSVAVQRFPIGILPVGKRNTIAFQLNNFREKNLKNYEVLAESTMCAIKQILKPIDVMKIEGKKGNAVFAVDLVNCGQISDTFKSVEKYWYFGNHFKPYLAFILNSFKSLSSVECLNISYRKPCSGCSQCYKRFEVQPVDTGSTGSLEMSTRWWHRFMSRKAADNQTKDQTKRDLRSVVNENCNQWSTMSDINAANILVKNTNECKLQLTIHSEPLAQNQFISDGVKLYNCQPLPETTGANVQVIEVMDINIDLPIDSGDSDVKASDDEPSDGTEDKTESKDQFTTNSWFSIDTESYERQSIRITLLPKMLNMYAL